MIIKDIIPATLQGYVTFIAKNAITQEIINESGKQNIVVNDAKYALVHGVTECNAAFLISSLKLGSDFTDAWVSGTGSLTQTMIEPRILDITGGDFNVIFGTYPQPNSVYLRIGTQYRLVLSWSATQATLDQAFTATVAAVSVWEWVGNGNTTFIPQAAVATYNETTMKIVFDSNLVVPPPTFITTYGSALPFVDLSMVIVGQEVVDQNGGVGQVDFTSAALHTGGVDRKVFSYVRFPRYSITPLIDITILWRLTY